MSWIAGVLILGFASSAVAAPATFSGTLTIRLPVGDLVTSGSGTGSSDGRGLAATIAGGEFAILNSASVIPPLLGVITEFELAAPLSPGVPGSNGPLNWTGFNGTMPLNASAFVRGLGGLTLGGFPLNVAGVGGTEFFTLGGFAGTFFGSPYQTGFFFLSGSAGGSRLFVSATGSDARTPAGNGLLQVVAPALIRLDGTETIPAAAILALDFTVDVPPPPNDDFADATSIAAIPYVDDATTVAATLEPGEPQPSCGFGSLTRSIWWSFTPGTTDSLSARASAPFSTLVAVYAGDSLATLSEVACGEFGDLATFRAEAGVTYHFQAGGIFGDAGPLQFSLDVASSPQPFFSFSPFDPSAFDTIQFFDSSFDPANVGIETQLWDFGDGTTETGCCPTHQYAADGEYTVELTVTTFDGRFASTSQVVSVETHDVAITKFQVPNSARSGQTRGIRVGLNSRLRPEQVQVELFRSNPGGGFDRLGTLTQTVPVRKGNRTTNFAFSYTFTEEDAAVGKVTFRATASILGARDAFPADNEAIAAPTSVK